MGGGCLRRQAAPAAPIFQGIFSGGGTAASGTHDGGRRRQCSAAAKGGRPRTGPVATGADNSQEVLAEAAAKSRLHTLTFLITVDVLAGL